MWETISKYLRPYNEIPILNQFDFLRQVCLRVLAFVTEDNQERGYTQSSVLSDLCRGLVTAKFHSPLLRNIQQKLLLAVLRGGWLEDEPDSAPRDIYPMMARISGFNPDAILPQSIEVSKHERLEILRLAWEAFNGLHIEGLLIPNETDHDSIQHALQEAEGALEDWIRDEEESRNQSWEFGPDPDNPIDPLDDYELEKRLAHQFAPGGRWD